MGMIGPYRWLALLLAAFALASGPAAAQDAFIAPEPRSQYIMNLGVGGAVVPQYPGADKYMFVPYPIIEFGRLYLPFIGQTEKKTRGVFIYPSFNIIGEREASDDNSLQGTKKIDWAFEAGVGGGFRYDWFRAYATIRQGFNGYSGQTGEIGANTINAARPAPAPSTRKVCSRWARPPSKRHRPTTPVQMIITAA
jgi:outer membrane scaffolding protein for murein synthesis (MipA/OmpV family)